MRPVTTEDLGVVRDHLTDYVDRVEAGHGRVVVTRDGRPAAVLISPEELESIEETLSVVGDVPALRELREAHAAITRGDSVHGTAEVRALRPPRKR